MPHNDTQIAMAFIHSMMTDENKHTFIPTHANGHWNREPYWRLEMSRADFAAELEIPIEYVGAYLNTYKVKFKVLHPIVFRWD